MPPFTLDLTDPKPADVRAAMEEAVKTANGKARVGLLEANPADYRKFLAKEFKAPEGVMMWLSDQGRVTAYPPTPRGTLLGVVWRTTVLGRAVRVVGRRVEPFQEGPTHRFGPPYRPWPPLCHLDPDHVVTRQFANSEPEVIAVCACGEVGPPEELAWEAEGVCGPCHDHTVDTGKPLEPAFGPPALRATGQLRRVGWLPSGNKVVAWEWFVVGYRNSTSRLTAWDRHTGKCQEGLEIEPCTSVPAKNFKRGLVMPARDLCWIPARGKPVSWPRPTSYRNEMAVHGTTAATVRYRGEVFRRELTVEEEWKEWRTSQQSNDGEGYYSIAFSPKGDRLALGRGSGLVDVLDWPDGTGTTMHPKLAGTQRDDFQRVHALAFSPDGKFLATANGQSGFVEDPAEEWYGWGGSTQLFDVGKGKCIAHFPRERDDILTVAFSPDGSLLFTGATDCQIRVVEVASREEIATLCGHIGCVNDLAFSPDGETLASAGGDGVVRLWPWRKILNRPAPKAKKKR